ncbi:MAG TPA: hypothetical protein VKA03_09425 [Methylovirgula sp.]|nr:hypothetical protein [Methylovirgula sp.]
MKLSGKLLLASLIGLGLGLPESFAATGGHAMAPRVMGMQPPARPQALARQRPGLAGLGASGAYSTLLSGTFEWPSAGEEAGFVVPPPFCGFPVVVPRPCIRSLLIHLVPPHHPKLPRVVYGSPYTCS